MQASITLGRASVLALRSYCRKHRIDWFVAKDQGAYVGAARGPIHYFDGCDPSKDPFDTWWSNVNRMFGGDDFGEHLPMDWLDQVARDKTIKKLRVNVKPRAVEAEFVR